jgi:hypothetical protein
MKEVISRIFWVFLNVSPRRHLSRPSLISISFHRTIIMKKAVVVTLGISLLVTVSYRDILSPWLYSLNGREDNHLHQRELHLTSEGESDHSRMAAGKVGSSNKRTNKNFVKGSNNNNSQKTKSNETPTRTPPSLLVPRPRPIMHTFFTELVPENPNDPHQITAGMTPAAHNSMLLVWQKSWQQAGWDTRILTMEDAMEHVDFDALRAKIEQQFRMNDYDKARYYRWIAMAAAGGGWMSGMLFISKIRSQALCGRCINHYNGEVRDLMKTPTFSHDNDHHSSLLSSQITTLCHCTTLPIKLTRCLCMELW